jgi:2-polyprenyl-6-methoxyphenol hydroxylase-like FAD-dependent oxidoreductase
MPQAERVIVAGAGMAGMAAALMLARTGRQVLLVERDEDQPGSDAAQALLARRAGVPHFNQPHAFLPRGFTLLRDRLPDVLAHLRALGAIEVDIAPAAGEPGGGDEDMVFLGVRRPMIEWALRHAVRAEPNIEMHCARIDGLILEAGAPPTLRGFSAAGQALGGSLAVDAMGRMSPTRRWLAEHGVEIATESSDVGIVYYSRYYHLRDGVSMPPSPSPFGPRADLGFASAATFLGDNRTYAIVLMVPAWDTELKIVRRAGVFDAFCRATPALAALVDEQRAQALTEVLPMGALQTVWNAFDREPVRRLIAIGDSFCHTDPSFALGICNALIQGAALADVAAIHEDWDVPQAFHAAVRDELRERFEFARDVAAARVDRMKGLPVAISRSGCYPLYALMASLGAASLDAQVHRMAYRRHGFLDRLALFDDDDGMQRRVEELFPQVLARMRDAPRVDRAELLQMLGSVP